MVKILGQTEEELKARERLSKLVEIAKQVFPEARVSTLENHDNYLSVNLQGDLRGTITVHLLGGREIHIYNNSLLQSAVKLAESYENSGEPEFTVKKGYSEMKDLT